MPPTLFIKYDIPAFTLYNCMALMTLYFPALIWEVSRKLKAPKDENDYVTYSLSVTDSLTGTDAS